MPAALQRSRTLPQIVLAGLVIFATSLGCDDDPVFSEWPELTTAQTPDILLDGLDDPAGITALDGSFVLAERGADTLRWISGDGTADGLLATGVPGPSLILAVPGGILVTSEAPPGIWSVAGAADPESLWSGQADVLDLHVQGGRLWFSVSEGESSSASLRWLDLEDGGDGVVGEDLIEPTGITGTSDSIVVADAGSGELLAFDSTTGVETLLAAPDESPRDVVADQGDLVFTARSERWPGGGWVYGLPEAGGPLDSLSYSPPGIDRVVVAGGYIYWTSAQSITRAPRSGGSYEVLATETRVADFCVTKDRLVWTDPDRGQLLSVPLSQ
jgi:hypothetical protein